MTSAIIPFPRRASNKQSARLDHAAGSSVVFDVLLERRAILDAQAEVVALRSLRRTSPRNSWFVDIII